MNTDAARLLQVRLMATEAKQRIASANLLSASAGDHGDSAHLLELLALELLLKASIRIHTRESARGHKYQALFRMLPGRTQASLLAVASERVGPDARYAEIGQILAEWGQNFVSLRYPFERYEGMDYAQYVAKGRAWIESGADESVADFRYYPEELAGLLFALENAVSSWLSSSEGA